MLPEFARLAVLTEYPPVELIEPELLTVSVPDPVVLMEPLAVVSEPDMV